METVFVECTKERKSIAFKKRAIMYQYTGETLTMPTFTMATRGLPPGYERNVTGTIGLGISSEKKRSQISMTPFAALYTLNEVKGTIRTKGKTLHIESESNSAAFDIGSGRPIHLAMNLETQENETGTIQLKTELGGMQRLLQEMDARRDEASWTQVSSVWELIVQAVDNGERSNSQQQRTYLAYQKLLHNCFTETQEGMKKAADKDEKFQIPVSKELQTSEMAIAAMTLFCTNQFFAEGTQPWSYTRELAALLALKDPESALQITRILQDQNNGPMMYWLFSEMATYFPLVPAEKLAQSGIAQLGGENYKHDLQQFANSDGALGKLLLELGKGIREFPRDELRDLLPMCSDDRIQHLIQTRDASAVSDEKFTLEILDALWHDSGIKERLHLRLQSHLSQSEDSPVKLTSGEEN